MLMKDWKNICRTRCHNLPFQMPRNCSITDIVRVKTNDFLSGLPKCVLIPDPENSQQQREWGQFMSFLKQHKKVAIAKVESYGLYICPPDKESDGIHAVVYYKRVKTHEVCDAQKHGISGGACFARGSNQKFLGASEGTHVCESMDETFGICGNGALTQSSSLKKNYMRAHPSYLKTLGQAHSGWIFGAIAELVDNSRDAKASRLEISIDMVFLKSAGKDVPMLSVIDDGHGMTHQEIVKMIAFGHKQTDADDPNQIGRFGIGFKTGAMRLGKDALVLTQTVNSRSIAFLSQSLNEGKDNLEIPIVSYQRQGQIMQVDTYAQAEASAKYNLKAIKEFSPFNKYLIGEKAGLFREGTGTQIYIWNLDKWGTDYCLEWQIGRSGGSSFHQGDIFIRSKRIRSRPGQTSNMVPLDYSLQCYLEVIALDPRMKIFVQGSLVKSRPLAKSLNGTVVKHGKIMGKPVELILGRCQIEWEQANCGIFLYWHGRLIEAYKRVGGMIHSADTGRGVIGVIDVTDLMNDSNGQVWVHNNKQGFQDCETYARLEEWLGNIFDQYWDSNFDMLEVKKGSALYKPDHEWVQCNKCRKWRMLVSGFDTKQLPQEWFCYMYPFNGKCEIPEQKVEDGVITVSTKRSGGIFEGGGNDSKDSSQTQVDIPTPGLKRLRRGPTRFCRKAYAV
ncbi:hypothetical protein NMG60_11007701 [Bertholletia excelsa]